MRSRLRKEFNISAQFDIIAIFRGRKMSFLYLFDNSAILIELSGHDLERNSKFMANLILIFSQRNESSYHIFTIIHIFMYRVKLFENQYAQTRE